VIINQKRGLYFNVSIFIYHGAFNQTLIVLTLLLISTINLVSAYRFDVPQDVKDRAERITLDKGEEVEVGNLTILYNGSEAVYTKFLVEKDGEWVYFSSDSTGGIVYQLMPLWTNNIVIHVEKIGPEGSEDLNYVDDDSEITVWVDNAPDFIISCGEYIEEPKNIGVNTGNFYSGDKEILRHKFSRSYYYPPEILFTYAFDIVHEPNNPYGILTPGEFLLNLRIYEEENFETPTEIIPFSACGDATFTYNNTNFLIQPFYFMENGNWDIALREVNRICPKNIPNPDLSAIRPSDIKIINLGMYDDVRKPLSNLWARYVERLGDSSLKIDFKASDDEWGTYVFDDCGWRSIDNGPHIRLAGLYGKEAEFYVVTSSENYPSAKKYNPFWDKILEVLGFY